MRLNEYVGLWGRYRLKQVNTLYFIFKTLIQLYLFCLFLYSLTYCIKEVIEDINLEIKWKSVGLLGNYGLKQVNPLQFFKTQIKNICFVCELIYLLYHRGYQRQYSWTLHLKVLAHEAATAWNRGIPGKILNFLIRSYLFCLLIYCFN